MGGKSRELELCQRFGEIKDVWHSFAHFPLSFFSTLSRSRPKSLEIKFPWFLGQMTSDKFFQKEALGED